MSYFFFFNDSATTEIYSLSLHDALPISVVLTCADWMRPPREIFQIDRRAFGGKLRRRRGRGHRRRWPIQEDGRGTCRQHERSEEHTSELQSPCNLVCRLLLEKKKKTNSV